MTPLNHPTVESELHQSWDRKEFTIAMDGCDPVRVDGIAMRDVPDIGLHVGITHFIDVTHIPTGKRIGGFHTLGAAIEFVHRIAYLTDWSLTTLAMTEEEEKTVRGTYAALLASEKRPARIQR